MYFNNPSSEFIYIRTYAKWIDELGRRETWEETVKRYVDFLKAQRGGKVPPKVFRKIEEYMLSFSVMPSMRALWAAGPAAEKDNTTFYNCSFLAVDSVDSFAECLHILMCGTGVGFSVEKEFVSKLPQVPSVINPFINTHVIEDSKKGWADSIKILMGSLYEGHDVQLDYNLLRPSGARLQTMGGKSSGPAPLANLHAFIRDTFNHARGRQLTTLECHDIMNEIA